MPKPSEQDSKGPSVQAVHKCFWRSACGWCSDSNVSYLVSEAVPTPAHQAFSESFTDSAHYYEVVMYAELPGAIVFTNILIQAEENAIMRLLNAGNWTRTPRAGPIQR